METTKVVEWVDIQASRAEVFDLILNLERRLQLSPLWGMARIESIAPNFPAQGSRYHVRILKGGEDEYDTLVTCLAPGRKFAYRLLAPQETVVTWTVQDIPSGTRVVYEEEFLAGSENPAAFEQAVRKVVKSWLENMRRYCELRQTRFQRLLRWLLDRYFLRLRSDQRQVIATILFMHAVGAISFVMAAIAWGIASLVS